MRSLRSSTRLTTAAVVAVALATVLTGCGSDSKDSKDSAPTKSEPKVNVLSEPEATTALMVEANLGGQFKVTPDDSDDTDAPGCMKGVSEVLGDDDDAENTAERDFTATDENTNIALSNKVLSYKTTAAAEKAIEAVRKTLADCTSVTESDDDGYSYELKVESDDDKAESSVDDQVNATASGTVTATAGGSGKIVLYLALVRVDNNITAVTASTLDQELPGPVSDLVSLLTDRLDAVVDGKQPDDTVVAGS